MGKVTDEKGNAQANATIRIIETGGVSHTDNNGNFRLALSPGNYTLIVNHLSFTPLSRSITVKSGETTRLNLQVADASSALEEVVVTALGDRKSVV